jgi:hypothetical protein
MENKNLISPKIVVSQNTATMYFNNNERSYLQPQFNYNTTIVELKPFKKSNHSSTISNYDGFAGGRKSLTDSASFDLIKKNTLSQNSTTSAAASSTFSSTKFDELMFNKIMKQKKFLINKNMRFYQPVKDAEMLVHLDLLRSKLQTDKFSEGVSSGDQFYRLSRSKTNYVDTNDNDPLKMLNLKNPRNSLVYQNSVISNSSRNNDNNNELSFSAENSPTLTNAGNNFPFETNNQESEFTDDAEIRYLFKNDDLNERSDDYSIKSNNNINSPNGNQDKYLSSQKLNKFNNMISSNQKNQDEDFEKLKKYARINKKQQQYDQTKSLTDDQIKQYLKRNLKSNNNNNRQENLKTSRQNTFANDNQNFNKESTFISQSINMNRNESILMGKNNMTTSTERLKLKTANANLRIKKKNFDHVVRKSSKYRLDNIYKPLEHTHLIDILKNDSKLIDSNYSTRTSSETRIHSNKSIELLDSNGAFRSMSNNTKYNCDMNLFVCQDPACEYKRYIDHLNLKTKKEYPNERFQRMKNKKVEPIPNIINDIPSTLNTMSRIGVPTNVERLLTKGLTEFYTKNSQGRLVDFN